MSLAHIHVSKLITSLILVQSVGLVGMFSISLSPEWYTTLVHTSFSPSIWMFSPIWTIIYTFVGTALYFAWVRHLGGHKRILWLRIFVAHLIPAFAWSVFFFYAHQILFSLITITILFVSILILASIATRFDKRVTLLLLPYMAWVGFVTYLNYILLVLNT